MGAVLFSFLCEFLTAVAYFAPDAFRAGARRVRRTSPAHRKLKDAAYSVLIVVFMKLFKEVCGCSDEIYDSVMLDERNAQMSSC